MKTIISVAALALLTGCASQAGYGLVVPLENNQYETTGYGRTETDALQDGLSAAEYACSSRNLRHVITRRETRYKGVLANPTTNEAVSTVADTVVAAPFSLRGENYQIGLTFKCEPK